MKGADDLETLDHRKHQYRSDCYYRAVVPYPVRNEPRESISDGAGREESSQSTGKLCSFVEQGQVEDDTRIESTD